MSLDYRLDKFYDLDDAEPEQSLLAEELSEPDRYRDFVEVGRGGMKTVYKVFDSYSQRYVAFAQLQDAHADVLADEFIREARLTAKLPHPNIIPIYDVGIHPERGPFFVMELKGGTTLSEIIRLLKVADHRTLERFSVAELLTIFVKICDAISFAHSRKIVHLDIKPDNIQVGGYGEVIVCDWGVSKIYGEQKETEDFNQLLINPDLLNSHTLHGQIKGTPGFMAPELFDCEEKTPEMDVYSLGCVLYSLLTLTPPVSGDIEKIADTTRRGDIVPLREIVPDIDPGLAAVAMKAMRVDPADRYASVEELKDEIDGFMHGYATIAEEAGIAKRLKLFILRNKTVTAIVGAGLIAAIIGLAYSVSQIKAGERDAVEEKIKALENLALFKEEQRKTEAALVASTVKLFHLKFYYDPLPLLSLDRTIGELETLLESFPASKEVHAALGYHHFLRQDFAKAQEYFAVHSGKDAYMVRHAAKYAKLKSGLCLSGPDLAQLLRDLGPYKMAQVKLLMVHGDLSKDPKSLVEGVGVVLRKWNPDWQNPGVLYDAKTQALTISGDRIDTIYFDNVVPFKGLPIRHLSIAGTKVSNLKGIHHLPITEIDVSGTPIDLNDFRQYLFDALEKVIVDQSQRNRGHIPEHLTVEVKE